MDRRLSTSSGKSSELTWEDPWYRGHGRKPTFGENATKLLTYYQLRSSKVRIEYQTTLRILRILLLDVSLTTYCVVLRLQSLKNWEIILPAMFQKIAKLGNVRILRRDDKGDDNLIIFLFATTRKIFPVRFERFCEFSFLRVFEIICLSLPKIIKMTII